MAVSQVSLPVNAKVSFPMYVQVCLAVSVLVSYHVRTQVNLIVSTQVTAQARLPVSVHVSLPISAKSRLELLHHKLRYKLCLIHRSGGHGVRAALDGHRHGLTISTLIVTTTCTVTMVTSD
ncbi:unnamed protein product [Lampetra fluviatilis]